MRQAPRQKVQSMQYAYILNAVVLASILFLGGIVSRFDWPPVRIGIIVVALVLLAYGLYNLATYPIA
jgi:hypothetical protein